MLEIEAKMRLADHSAAHEALRRLGAQPLGKIFETNVFLDTPDRHLLHGGSGLRVRRNHHVDSGRDELVITYKGPLEAGPLKSRPEIEVTVNDFDRALALLEHLGYAPNLRFEKRRESWKLDGCKIELDELPHLGHFIEIEGPDEPTVMRVRERLGLAGAPLERRSYAELLDTYLREHRIGAREVRFSPG
jgi:adenylate cyclase class 2